MKKLAYISLISVLSTSLAFAGKGAAVDSHSCNTLKGTKTPFVLVLDSGESLIESMTRCAKDAGLQAASVSGLGQLHNPSLAYFTSNPTDKPTVSSFPGYYELASLNGNITNNNGQYYTHVHGVLADQNFHGIAGHINNADVGLTVEITIVPLALAVERTVDAKTGFGPIVH
jgi:predicted DNA-binding protein with PD1-like motif